MEPSAKQTADVSLSSAGEAVGRPALLGLRGKIALLAILLAVLPVLLSSLSQVSATEDELKSAVQDRLVATGAGFLDQIRLSLEPARSSLALLGGALSHPSLGQDEKLALLDATIERLPHFLALELIPEGAAPASVLRASLKRELDSAGVSMNEVLKVPPNLTQTGHRPGVIGVGDPLRAPLLKTWVLPVWLALSDSAIGRPAVLLAFLDLRELQQLFHGQRLRKGEQLWLVDRRGLPLFSKAALPVAPELEPFTGVPAVASRGVLMVTAFQAADGAAMLGAIAISQETGWTLMVAVPEAVAYATVSRMRSDLSFWMSLGLLAALIGAALLAQRISKPVREMALVADRVGHGDFSARVTESQRRDEVGTLGRRLNRMILRLSEANRHLQELAHRDFLTGLLNRRSVFDLVAATVAEATQRDERIALLFLDLDRFKKVNDSLGHALGDQLLVLAADRLSRLGDKESITARLGGDEFLVVLRDVADRAEVERAAVGLVESFRAPFSVKGYDLYLGVSVGISIAPDDGVEMADLIDKADMAMYLAKERGRDHYQFFDAALKAQAVRKLALDVQLRRAIEHGALELYYQPQVDVGTGKIVAFEALARWPDPQGGFISAPREFIPLAEENGLILSLGDWAVEQVCLQLKAWREAGLPEVCGSVNVSAVQFSRRDFLERLLGILDRTGLEPRLLGLELTESVLLDDVGRSIRLMRKLKDAGLSLMIDDFGTGYSSLAYLRRFPLDYVKVAQEFVCGIESNANDATIVSAVIALSKSLGLKVIAEGVETDGQLDFLRERNCDLVQGYYSGQALTAAAFAARLVEPSSQSLAPGSPVFDV